MRDGKCKLCLVDKELQESHLMPASLYDLCRAPDSEPVFVTSQVVMHTSRQTKHPLLCWNCEQLISSSGESWVLPRLATIDGKFPLVEILTSRPPEVVDDESTAYAAAKNPGIDVSKLLHFASSIFWKAAVHSWKGGQTEPQIELGPYADPLRRFVLKAGPFPTYMA